MRLARLSAAALALLAACADDSTSPVTKAGPPAAVVADAAASLAGLAGKPLTNVTLKVRDAGGRGVAGQTVTFSVQQGGGTLAAPSAVSGADGSVTLPAWTLGKSAVPQVVRATVGSVTSDITATVQTAYDIDVRFFGTPMSEDHKVLFTNAAARLRAIITSDVIGVSMGTEPVELATSCGVSGLPSISETIDDVIIYAAVQDIDGPGKVLAQAGPCLVRTATHGRLTAVGVMSFDAADVVNLANGGRLQDVITHEMLHVLGIGTLWRTREFLTDAGLETVAYNQAQARLECQQNIGGASICATSIPVENQGGAGTRDGHWRESTFDSELMTGFAESSGAMPLSLMTIGALTDLGYGVNRDAKDNYTVPMPLAMNARADATPREAWEAEMPMNLWEVTPSGRRNLLRPKVR